MNMDYDPVERLYDAILKAQTSDPQSMRANEAAFQELLKERGTLLRLQTIVVNRGLDIKARQLAIIQAKNITPLQWKSRARTPEEDLPIMRQNILSLVDEPDDVIARNNQTMAAKAARLDFPVRWPTLLTDIMGIIQTNIQARFSSNGMDELVQLKASRALGLLNAILKEFTSMKSPLGTQITTKANEALYPFLLPLVEQTSSQVQNTLSPATINHPVTIHDVDTSRLAWKCLIKIMLWAWNKARKPTPQEEEAFQRFFAMATSHVQLLWGYRLSIATSLRDATLSPEPGSLRCLELLTKHVKAFGKAFRRMQQTGIARFVELPNCNPLVLSYWDKVVQATHAPPDAIAESYTALYPVHSVVQGLAIFKDSLAQWSPVRKSTVSAMETDSSNGWSFQPDDSPWGVSYSLDPPIESPKEVLSEDLVKQAITILITRFIPLKPADLEKWQEDPEEFLNIEDKENEAWEYDIRPCAERVLMTLATQYPDYVSPLLQALYQSIILSNPTDLDQILQREAIYCALGRCAHRMKALINFDEWLNVLENEAQNPSPQYRLMKRRIAWLLGKWHFDDTRSLAVNKKVWEILLAFLTDRSEGSDSVVRLTSVVALYECVENNDFSIDAFEPYLAQVLGALFALINEAETVESKSRILKTINCVIGQAGLRIVPLIKAIADPIPGLWSEAGNDFMIKQQLLGLVKEVIDVRVMRSKPTVDIQEYSYQASREYSQALYGLIVPLVQESLAPGSKTHLDEDGAILWEAAIRNCSSLQAPAGQASLMDLLPNLVNELSDDLDLLGTVNKLLESYYLIDCPAVLQLCAPQLLAAYANAHRQAISTNIKDITESLELMLQLSGSALNWAQAMHTSGFFASLLTFAIVGKGSVSVVCDHFYVFSRMALQDPEVFIQLVVETAPSRSETPEKTLNSLMDSWLKFDSMAEPRHRKLTAMALASLATTGRPEIINRLPNEIVNVWLDVFGEIKEAESDDPDNPSPLHTFWTEGSEPPVYWMRGCENTLEEQRRKKVWSEDPVQSVKLTVYIGEKLSATAMRLGQDTFNSEFVNKTDADVFRQLQDGLTA
ncbi:hypothetical protein FRB99_003271 [Tulasnella sp. 403]|nr:hypothetical protein FRB99_003271 [Tulasnella sp. 403]